jgi:2-oxo-3-hexenedioate decarboxylase
MTEGEIEALARKLADAYANRRPVAAPSARDANFDLTAAYDVETHLSQWRRADGHASVGRKVGYANKAMWRVLKLDTLVWAHMYDDTVQYASGSSDSLHVGRMYSAKIEPEIVFKLRTPPPDGGDPSAVLGSVEWMALGFEIIDCVFPDWKFQPADFVAAYGLHAALIVGEPIVVLPDNISALADALGSFTVTLQKNGRVAAEGSGRNSLRSPALCLAELASAIHRSPAAEPLVAGEIISSGTLTESQPIAAGETWTAVVNGLDLPSLTVHTIV